MKRLPLLALGALFLAGGALHLENARLSASLAELQPKADRSAQQAARLAADIKAARALEKARLPQNLAARLTPPDKPKLLALLEAEAEEANLSRFKARFGAESPPRGLNEAGLAASKIEMEGDAPDDLHLKSFIKTVLATLPGERGLSQITLTRPHPAKPLGAANLHFHLTFAWLANATPFPPN